MELSFPQPSIPGEQQNPPSAVPAVAMPTVLHIICQSLQKQDTYPLEDCVALTNYTQ